jgi:SAM-dependent methyltransferase
MAGPDWHHFPALHARLASPLRPAPGDVAGFRRAIEGGDGKVLLLGVTPELSVLGQSLVAVDASPRMIERVWPGDSDGRRAILGEWSALPFENGSFDAVIGDGSLNSAPDRLERVLAEAKRVLAPSGRAVFRLFCSPELPESLSAIEADVAAGRGGNIHALKWRIAMALAAARPDAVVFARSILAEFNRMFPGRDRLAAATGWSREEIATLDAYVDADHSLGFWTLSRTIGIAASYFASASVTGGEGYPLAERCPIVTFGNEPS